MLALMGLVIAMSARTQTIDRRPAFILFAAYPVFIAIAIQ